jgi:DNA primase
VEASGIDPCELRQKGGDAAVRNLIEDAVPMFEFAVRTTIARFDLTTAEGRVRALGAAAPIVADIRDRSLRPEYTRTVAGWLGVEVEQVANEVARATRLAAHAHSAPTDSLSVPGSPRKAEPDQGGENAFELSRPDLRNPVVSAERQLLQAALQFPSLLDPAGFESIDPASFSAPAHRAVHEAMRAAGGVSAAHSPRWADRVSEAAALTVRPLVSELAVAPVPARFDPLTGLPERRYVEGLLVRIQEVALTRQISDAISAMRRLPPDDTASSRDPGIQLQNLQRELANLRSKLG